MSNQYYLTPSGTDLPAGISLKNQHFSEILEKSPDIAFFEVHAENFMSEGGTHHRYLEAVCEEYALSVHGVGMSLGSAEGIDKGHLQKFKAVVDRYSPWLISEHLAWSNEGGYYLNDLLPLPLNGESLAVVTANINRMQDCLGRKILIENPSAYMAFSSTDMPETEFLVRLAENTGCGLLLDVNNVYVSGKNMGWSVETYLKDVPSSLIGEIHLAGHTLKPLEGGTEIRIDDHGSEVCAEVWELYRDLTARVGVRPTLVEWDTNIPSLNILLTEAAKAADIMEDHMALGEASA
jgi:uncharacterized protein